MKNSYRILILISALMLTIMLSAFISLAECEHEWKYTPAGESSHTVKCIHCGETKTENHALTTTKTPPSCAEPSIITYSCAVCGYSASYQDGEPGANHSFGAYTVSREATCEKEGVQTRICTVCGAKENETIAKTEHHYGEWQKYDEKWHIRYCKVCDWAYKGSHRLDDGKIVTEPNETTLGEIAYTCRVCGETFSRSVSADGTIYVQSPENVLGNGAKYLLIDTGNAGDDDTREIKLTDGSSIDILSGEATEISVYANVESGAYAGLSVSGGQPTVEVLPESDGDTVVMEFIRLASGTSLKMRIFNSEGAVAVSNAGGRQLFISQKKHTDGSIVTLVMQIFNNGNHLEGSARLYSTEKNELTLTYGKNEYSVVPAGKAKLLGQAIWDYHKTSGKLTVNALNHEEDVDGIVYSVMEDNVHLMTARGIKKASGNVKTSSSDAVWRLRITFPCGYAIETPGYLQNGAFKRIPAPALMSEEEMNAPVDTEAAVESTAPTGESAGEQPDVPETEPETKETDAPDEPPLVTEAEDAIPLSGVVSLVKGSSALYVSGDLSSLTTRYESDRLTVFVSGLPEGYRFSYATCITSGAGFNFKIKTAYSLPAVFEIPANESLIEITVIFEGEDGSVIEASAGEFSVSNE